MLVDDDELLVIDKPSGIPVHGGELEFEMDVVTRLAERQRALGKPTYLGVHQRLDQGASGVLAFTRSERANELVRTALEQGELHRRYVAVVSEHRRLPDSGVFEHRLLARKGEPTRVVRQGGQEARARFRVLGRAAARALVALEPETGRTHQLRVQLAHSGAPIVGDRLYGGAPAPRLFLHAQALTFRDRTFTAPDPQAFRCWLDHGALPPLERQLPGALWDALTLRSGLGAEHGTFRLVNGAGDLLEDVVVDAYGAWAVVQTFSEAAERAAPAIASLLVERGYAGVYLKRHVRADLRGQDAELLAPSTPLLGAAAPAELEVHEGALKYLVCLSDGLSTGLFVDQRDNRRRIARSSAGKRVLNLFSYTCSFSVAAAFGGAAEVTSVDISRRALERGRANFELNGLPSAEHRFFKEDALEWLPRAVRRGERYDVIVLDPPSFGSRKRGAFSVERDYRELVAHCLQLLTPGGELLAVSNHRKTSLSRLRQLVRDAARDVCCELAQLKDLRSGLDCPEGPDGPEPSKSLLARRGR